MPIMLEQLPDEPILIGRYSAPLDPTADFPPVVEGLKKLVAQYPDMCFSLSNLAAVEISFDAIIEGLAAIRQLVGAGQSLRIVAVANSDLIKMAAEWLTQPQYGSFQAGKMFASEAEALAYIREELAKAK